jgi:hypothetical protein
MPGEREPAEDPAGTGTALTAMLFSGGRSPAGPARSGSAMVNCAG